MPTGFGPAGSGVLDGADGDLEHRNKITSLFWNDRMNYPDLFKILSKSI